jgi:hypothetical protein
VKSEFQGIGTSESIAYVFPYTTNKYFGHPHHGGETTKRPVVAAQLQPLLVPNFVITRAAVAFGRNLNKFNNQVREILQEHANMFEGSKNRRLLSRRNWVTATRRNDRLGWIGWTVKSNEFSDLSNQYGCNIEQDENFPKRHTRQQTTTTPE